MPITIRHTVFETNSSSTHTMTIGLGFWVNDYNFETEYDIQNLIRQFQDETGLEVGIQENGYDEYESALIYLKEFDVDDLNKETLPKLTEKETELLKQLREKLKVRSEIKWYKAQYDNDGG